MKSKALNYRKIAARLIETPNAALAPALENFSAADFLKLAAEIKELCYSFWTSEPAKTRISAEVLQNIYRLSPQKKILAYLEWNRGIAEITRGKLAAAIGKLDASAAIFHDLDDDYEAANTRVAKLYALALLGKYAEAIRCGEDALKVFEKHKDYAAQGKIKKNLGNLVARQGDERRAEKYYLAARRIFLKIKNVEELTMAENSLANSYAELNDFRRAERFYALALERARSAKMPVTEAEIEASLGNLALFRGRLDLALNFLETARRKYENLKMPHQTAIAELEIANVYLELNLGEEAAAIYETAAEKFRALKMPGEEAVARANGGRVAVAAKDFAAARRHLKKAARLFRAEGNRTGTAAVKIWRAKLELASKNYRRSLRIVDEIELTFKDSENTRHELARRLIKAEAWRNTSATAQSEAEFRRILERAEKSEQPHHAQTAHVALGKIAVARRDPRRAEKHFKRAIELNETMRAPLAAEEFRMAFQADKLAPFELLAKIHLAEKNFRQAFAVVEQAKARALAENLNEDLAAEKSASSGVLRKKLNELREELNWFYSRLNRAEESEIKNLQTESFKREKQIADVRRQIESTRVKTAAGKNFDGKTNASENLRRLQKQIGESRALIEFVAFDGAFSAFVVTDRKINFVADLARENDVLQTLESLQFQYGALRYGAETLGAFFDDLKRRADFHLRQLYRKLFAPLEKFVGDAPDLIVVPTGALHYVPFHALFDGGQYIVEKRRVVYAPSAAVWSFLASKRRKKSDDALLIGYADERIPLAEREIKSLGKLFGKAKTLLGERATVRAFAENAAAFDVLHLACHGQFRPENPLFSSLHLADGRVTVRDVGAMNLKAELVTLSACETGVHKIFAGEEILGLARGFLSAGAKSLILTLWTVNDAAATELMREFYERRRAGNSSAEALRIAQRGFIERGVHPYFWSPFVYIGK